jgi:type II secretory pathway pseudopilin PulG
MGNRKSGTSIRGFTILELVFYITLLTILGGPLVMVAQTVSLSSAEGDLFSRLLERNRSALHRISAEFRNSLRGTAAVSPDGKSLAFTSHGGFDGAKALAGPMIRYEIRAEAAETLNGTDDDGDGLVDEGLLARVDGSSGETVVILGGLDAGQSTFTGTAAGVDIAITTVGRTHRTAHIAAVRRTATVVPRS